MTEAEAEILAIRVDALVKVMRAEHPVNALAAWTHDFKRRLLVLVARDRERAQKRTPKRTRGPSGITRSAFTALVDCFTSAHAGGFNGDTRHLTDRQVEAAMRWIEATEAWLHPTAPKPQADPS